MKGKNCLKDAIKYLSARSRSESEIASYLARKGHEPESVAEVIAQLKAERLIDDDAIAGRWAAQLAESGKIGRAMAAYKLMQRGITKETAHSAVDIAWEGTDEAGAALEIISKSAIFTGDKEQDEKILAKQARRLKSKGFSSEAISKALRKLPDQIE
jgi:regulatory protein